MDAAQAPAGRHRKDIAQPLSHNRNAAVIGAST